MVMLNSGMSSQGEAESSLRGQNQQPKITLGRQSSIYSLTLDELESAVCDSGRTFGSMNMDEFIASIWSVDENQILNTSDPAPVINNENSNNTAAQMGMHAFGQGNQAKDKGKGIAVEGQPSCLVRQPSLARQVSIPKTLCQKTVEEVWAEIQRGQQLQNGDSAVNVSNPGQPAARQQTFGEITLEAFLEKAGVQLDGFSHTMQEEPAMPQQPPQPQQLQQPQQFSILQNGGNMSSGQGFFGRPMMGMPGGIGGLVGVSAIQGMPPPSGLYVGESSGYGGSSQRSATVFSPQPLAVAYGGSYVPPPALGIPMAPMVPDAMSAAPINTSAGQFGMEMSSARGRRRAGDGPVEKGIERRHRRMIKNRESAARSRARKQAYTIELEAELTHLKEENCQLKQDMEEYYNEVEMDDYETGESSTEKPKSKPNALRRTLSSPF